MAATKVTINTTTVSLVPSSLVGQVTLDNSARVSRTYRTIAFSLFGTEDDRVTIYSLFSPVHPV